MAPELLLAAALFFALCAYFLFGGADFGGGVWDLLARGERRTEQRVLIERAIGPIWEANHVWLILAAVLLFGGFPRAFAAVTTSLHVPLTLFLFAIVLRGSAFVFRAYDPSEGRRLRWGGVFSVASLFGPMLLGITVGTIASGRITLENGVVTSGFFTPWLSAYPLAVGAFSLALAAFLAATYLTHEAAEGPLAEDFRKRALGAGAAVGLLALVTLALSKDGAPTIYAGLTGHRWAWPLHMLTGISAIAAFTLLYRRQYRFARLAAASQAGLILAGWALCQYPYVLPPTMTLQSAAAGPVTLKVLLMALAVGTPLLAPSLWYLFRVFKSAPKVHPE